MTDFVENARVRNCAIYYVLKEKEETIDKFTLSCCSRLLKTGKANQLKRTKRPTFHLFHMNKDQHKNAKIIDCSLFRDILVIRVI